MIRSLECPKRHSAADNGIQWDRPEVAPIERCWFIPVHEKDLVARDDTAAMPYREHASAAVALAGCAHFDAIDCNRRPGTAYGLTGKCEDALDERHAVREITAVCQERCERLRRIPDHKRSDEQVAHRLHLIEPGRNAFGDVPNETRCRFWAEHSLDHGSGSYNGDKRDGTVCHEISFRRCSQA